MSQMIDRGTLDRLIALGRARGELTAVDLQAALPVDRMEVDALVLVMLELEAAGVSVEPEAFGPPADRRVPGALTLPEPSPGSPPPIRPAGEAGAPAFAASDPAGIRPKAAPERDPEDRAGVTRAVALAGLATLLVLGAVLLML
ncbi:RNA polymerase sigma factor region1.1 domain-containing protein [Methylobacterium sp. NEAU K]|uniref:RNA polymerase sigma factor region1.1 domain-containing protein n=1 Tax=Methylobacterium sp. NEAU K TaxID=3064946 RepID=UPI0027346D7D|nr:RNA polymerase sigma factor region1.1 domain-containing protein [Methylobacterium sp. NEAU K]MDP4005667.1 RNA polymerase sigma factor region1.1 domain-containing protein [Methylobacterium sp. NEAU K]